MHSGNGEVIGRARARKQRIADLEQELKEERTRYSHDLTQLARDMSLRQIALLLRYRSDTSVRRLLERARSFSDSTTTT
ncbi:hypothetical protein AB0B10_25940 [Micromonospora arborensis]|uniref:hypothetical protein n=1 Tax=Micromonospora arborensis TaxID=2116518 RepID=UPI0033DF3714